MQASLNQAQDAVQQLQSLRDDAVKLQARIHTAEEALQTSEVNICLHVFDNVGMTNNAMLFSVSTAGFAVCWGHCLHYLVLVMPTEHWSWAAHMNSLGKQFLLHPMASACILQTDFLHLDVMVFC